MALGQRPEKVLRLSKSRIHPQTLWRYYTAWREVHGVPERCDNPDCMLYVDGAVWNGQPLRLRLDHVDGNPCNNYPGNLRLLCPNCDAQLPTHGGKNKGRHRLTHAGWEHDRSDGLVDSAVFVPVADAVGDAPSDHATGGQAADS